jgi:hypothetical protein
MATERAIRVAARSEPLKALAVRVPDVSSMWITSALSACRGMVIHRC